MFVRVHNPRFTLMDQPEPDGQNSCAPPTQSYAHPNLELGPLALRCLCLHSAFQLNTGSATLAAPLERTRAPAERAHGPVGPAQPLPHPTFSCCSCSLEANPSCRSAISFSTCVSGRAGLSPQTCCSSLPFWPGESWASARRQGQTAVRTPS